MTTKEISQELLDILACPVCKGDLDYKKTKLYCKHCKVDYPIEEGIPILIPPKLRKQQNL